MENGRAKSTVVDIRAVEVSVLYSTFLGTMNEPFSRRLAGDVSYPLITTLQQEYTCASCQEMKAVNGFIFVSLMEMTALWRYVSSTILHLIP